MIVSRRAGVAGNPMDGPGTREAIRVSLPRTKLPSANALRRHAGPGGRYPSTRWRRQFERALPPLVGRAAWCTWPVVVEVRRVLGPRERRYDRDNLVGGCKPLLDALRAHGYIRDDSPEWLALVVDQVEPGSGRGDRSLPRIELWIRRM